MRGSTLLFTPTKTYGPISVYLRQKQKKSFSLSLSLSLSHSPVFSFSKMAFSSLFNFYHFLFFSFTYFFYFFYFPYYYFFLVLSFTLFPSLDNSHKCITCHAMCHLTSDVSKNVKFPLSRSLTKFDRVTRFCKTNSTVKSVSSSEI